MVVFAIYQQELATGAHVSPTLKPLPPPFPPHPSGLSQAQALSALLHASNLHWSPILHMAIYMFQCYSLKSSHLCLLPHGPKFKRLSYINIIFQKLPYKCKYILDTIYSFPLNSIPISHCQTNITL